MSVYVARRGRPCIMTIRTPALCRRASWNGYDNQLRALRLFTQPEGVYGASASGAPYADNPHAPSYMRMPQRTASRRRVARRQTPGRTLSSISSTPSRLKSPLAVVHRAQSCGSCLHPPIQQPGLRLRCSRKGRCSSSSLQNTCWLTTTAVSELSTACLTQAQTSRFATQFYCGR
jgi:hypothetical protein